MDLNADLLEQNHPRVGLSHGTSLPLSARGSWDVLELPAGGRTDAAIQKTQQAEAAQTPSIRSRKQPRRKKHGVKSSSQSPGAKKAAQRKAVQDVIDRFHTLDPLLHEAMNARDQGTYISQGLVQQRRWLQMSQQHFMNSLAVAMKDVQLTPSFNELQGDYQAVLDEYHLWDQQNEILQNNENEITGLMSRLDVENTTYMDAVRELHGALTGTAVSTLPKPASYSDQISALSNAVLEVQEAEDKGQEAGPIANPLLSWFRDCLGNVQIMRERLARLINDHAEKEAQRSFLLDRGQPVEPNETVFEAEYWSMIRQGQQDLAEATQALDHVRDICSENGISTLDDERAAEASFAELYPSNPLVDNADPFLDPSELDLENSRELRSPEFATMDVIDSSNRLAHGLALRSTSAASRTGSPAQRKEKTTVRINDWIDTSAEQVAPTAQERAADFLAQAEAAQPSSTRSSPALMPVDRTQSSNFIPERASSEPQITRKGSRRFDGPHKRRYSESQLTSLSHLFKTRQEAFDELNSAVLPQV